ncbi:MAG: flagellar basal body rod protein FlgC [Peptococcaceae bacterium]|jgi:flagellar basal-body rod protein FlgC|nr:flagellar basal body rod protein FlgC [Peptococcaceae bacterium]
MSLFTSFSISASALTAERLQLDLISNNLANINTAGTPGGGPGAARPYRREMPLFAQRLLRETGPDGLPVEVPGGVEVTGVVKDNSPPRLKYDPGNPLAAKKGADKGYVAYPNINVVNEMVDMITAVRTYQANVTAFNAAKAMAQKALTI